MSRVSVAFSAIALSFCILSSGSTPATAQTEQPIYGRQLMTEQEALKYRQEMRAATSDEERQRIRAEHHEEMQERAKSKGIVLPDEAPVRGMARGMGPGQGTPGQGTGSGQGMSPGSDR
jgi:hypothetical protein